MPSITWDSANTASDITLSGGNLTQTKTASSDHGSRTTVSFVNQKLYVEIQIGTASGGFTLGFGTSAYNPKLNYPGSGASSWAAVDGGDIRYNGANVGSSARLGNTATNGRMCLALDLVNMKAWFKNGTGNWNGDVSADPATNTNGLDISNLGAAGTPLWIASTCYFSGRVWTLKPGSADWAYSAPSGFVSINDNVGTLAATEAQDIASVGSPVWDIAQWDVALWPLTDRFVVTEAADTFSGTGAVANVSTMAAVEGQDVFAGTGSLSTAGNLAATEAKDVASLTGVLAYTGTLAATDAQDAFRGIGTDITGTLGATDAQDAVAVSAVLAVTGTLAATDTKDSARLENVLLIAGSNDPAAGGGANSAWKWPSEQKASEAAPEAARPKGLSDPLKMRNARIRGNKAPSSPIRAAARQKAARAIPSAPVKQRAVAKVRSAPQDYVIKSRW